jgi:hypothetical protein
MDAWKETKMIIYISLGAVCIDCQVNMQLYVMA